MLSSNESAINVTCEFTDEHPKASCVLVYKEYNKPNLTVIEYEKSTKFPVPISVDNPRKYTFAVFGKTDRIQAEPVKTWKPTETSKYDPHLGNLHCIAL